MQSLVTAVECPGHVAAASHAAADSGADAPAAHADVPEKSDDDAKRDWMHRLRPGDIVLVR